jgi:CheY-like chemotaxis protein
MQRHLHEERGEPDHRDERQAREGSAAADARSGLDLLAAAPSGYAGVVTDLHMPGMDGIALTRELRARFGAIPVILSSGRVDKSLAPVLAELRFAAQLDKPFTIESLSDALRRLLAARR